MSVVTRKNNIHGHSFFWSGTCEFIKYYCYFKKLANKCKEKFVILQSIGIIVVKQGQSSTPADILVDIINPYNSATGIKLSTTISVGVDDFPCFTTFYCYDSYYVIVKLQIFPYTCWYKIQYCDSDINIHIVTVECMHDLMQIQLPQSLSAMVWVCWVSQSVYPYTQLGEYDSQIHHCKHVITLYAL